VRLRLRRTSQSFLHKHKLAKWCSLFQLNRSGLGVWSPAALILDLRELSYTWGDEMDHVLSVGAECNLPTAIVGSGLCLPAIGTLIHGVNSTTPATDAEHIFDSIEEDWDYVHRKV